MNTIIVASNNKGKIAEIKKIVEGRFKVASLSEAGLNIDVEETGETFLENALIKAKTAHELTGMFVLSDDSGLCVDALGGNPGVYSARFAGDEHNDEKNNDLLLELMKDKSNRRARFKCAVVLYMGKDSYLSGLGEIEGEVLKERTGSNGFGYDVLFYSYELKKPFGLASAEEKNSISHRKRALEDLFSKINDIYPSST